MISACPWYKTLSRTQWKHACRLESGWLFDGFENYALILTAGPALRQLLDPAFHAQVPFYVGVIIGINLLGWGIGGLLGGILADYIGRKRMMVLAIMAYSIMTGLSAFAFSWWSFAALRFMVGIAVGSEWATGSSMIAELWPDRARGKGAGLMQCGLGMGFFLGVAGLAFHRANRTEQLALHVHGRRAPRPFDAVDPPIHSGIGSLGKDQ